MRNGRSVAQQEEVRRSGRLAAMKSLSSFGGKGVKIKQQHKEPSLIASREIKEEPSSPTPGNYFFRGHQFSLMLAQGLVGSSAMAFTGMEHGLREECNNIGVCKELSATPKSRYFLRASDTKSQKISTNCLKSEKILLSDGKTEKSCKEELETPEKKGLGISSVDSLVVDGKQGKRVLTAASSGEKGQRTPNIDVFSSDDDGVGGECGSAKRKKFYIVTNGERPSELFRTDLSYLKRDDDSSSDEEAPAMRVIDRWKEGWTHVQVPLSNNWPEFVVNNEPSSSSSAVSYRRPFQKSEKLIAVHDACYVDKRFTRVKMRPLFSYQCDRLDQIYLVALNKRRCEMGLPSIAEEAFIETINRFEVETYKAIHRDLLAPLVSPKPLQPELDEDASCDICRQADYEDDDKIIFCDGCNLSVHQSCYGLDSVPNDEWLCNACTLLGYKAQPRCVLCPLTGGAMKCMKGGETWAHVVCALWIPEIRFGDVDHREPITNISDIPTERWALRCSVCDTKQGACIQCSVKSCTTAFHVTCALRSWQEMRIEHDSTVDDGVRMVSLCGKHSQEANGMVSGTVLKGDSRRCTVKCTEPHEELRRMEQVFFLYVSPEEVSKDLGIELETVDDVYEYWKMKRIDNGNRTLLDDISEVEFRISSQEEYDRNPSSVLSVRVQTETKLRQNLEKARNLCYMVGRREKHKKEIIGCCEEMFAFVKSALNGIGVPLSRRTLSRYCEAISVYASLGGLEVPITPPVYSPTHHHGSSEKVKHASRYSNNVHSAASQTIIPALERSSTVSQSNRRNRFLHQFASLQPDGLVATPSVSPTEPGFFRPKVNPQHRKIREGSGSEFLRRTSSPSDRFIEISSAPLTNEPKWFHFRSSPHKIRERNGPDSPRRIPSQRASAIKANLSMDLAAHFPYICKRPA